MTHPKITVKDIEKYDFRVPRYTSYPTVPNWSSGYGPQEHLDQLEEIALKKEPLSMYIHIPFCIRRCLFCACNVLVSNSQRRVDQYLSYLKKEISKNADIVDREVMQLHFGGGTPTHLNANQLDDLLVHIEEVFRFSTNAERSIEIHPSVTTDAHIDILTDHGFNRMSIGVQDFDYNVQEKLNRYQSYDETYDLINYMRSSGVQSINVDLIYGLPYQTETGLQKTLQQLMNIRPDRVALYSYAHFPQLFRHHKSIPLDVIATGSSKLERFLDSRAFFLENGYEQIGFDHFTLKEDDLWKSYENKTLRRNFMGYTTKAGTDMLAFGYSSISELEGSYSQNSKEMKEYEKLIDKYGVATVKGHHLSDDDKLRKKLIMNLLCLGTVDVQDEFTNKYFSKFERFEEIGLIKMNDNTWELTPKGFVFGRVVASSFDSYYEQSEHLFSGSI